MPQSSEEPQIPLRSPLKLPYSLCEHIKHSHCPHPNSPTGAGEPERSSSHQGPSLDAPETVVASPEVLGWSTAQCRANQRLLPARGASGSPLTALPSRHWKTFRTSSQLSTPSLRVDPRRARRRRQRQPRRQVRASILRVRVAPSPLWSPLSRAPSIGGAGGRCVAESGKGSTRRLPREDRERTAASPARAPLSSLKR